MERSNSINPEPIRPVQGDHAKSHKHKKKEHEAPASERGRSSHAARRKFMAEAAVHVKAKDALPQQIIDDLTNLNKDPQNPSLRDKLENDIGGIGNLSSFRVTDVNPQSLLDLAASLSLTKAAATLLDMGFQFQSINADGTVVQNDIAPRFQWSNNGGYCGETSILNAALNNGEYISQYDLRAMATGGTQYPGMLVIGSGGKDIKPPYAGYVAKLLHLNVSEWNTKGGDTKAFLSWVKQQVLAGNPVIIGVYMNQYTFSDGKDTDPNAGDTEYDHIVTVTGIGTNHPLSDPTYHGDDTLYFSDNGLEGGDAPDSSPYIFSKTFDDFQGTRKEANSEDPDSPHSDYTLPDESQNNHGIAITGVTDPSKETLPVHLLTSINDEPNQPKDKVPNPKEPTPSQMTLTGCISGLTPGKTYNIYVYDDVSKIPDSNFNGNAKQAMKCITFTATGPNYVFSSKDIQATPFTTDQTVAFRVVPQDGK